MSRERRRRRRRRVQQSTSGLALDGVGIYRPRVVGGVRDWFQEREDEWLAEAKEGRVRVSGKRMTVWQATGDDDYEWNASRLSVRYTTERKS